MNRSIDYIKMAAIEELKDALKTKEINDELLEYLSSSLRWLIHYSNKYQIPLPEKEKISLMLDRIIDVSKGLPPKNKHPFSTPDDETEPKFTIMPFISVKCPHICTNC